MCIRDRYYIQRRRADVLKWLDEETNFPQRNSIDKDYKIGEAYSEVFNDILTYAREIISRSASDGRKQRYNFWDALALLRGVMSSPAAGVSMLIKKAQKKKITEEEDELPADEAERESVMDNNFSTDDSLPLSVLAKGSSINVSESKRLLDYAKRLEGLYGIDTVSYTHLTLATSDLV